MTMRVLAPLATIALVHAFGRFVGDPRPITGILRPLLALWMTGLGASYALTLVGHEWSRRMLIIWGVGSAIGFGADNFGLLSASAPAGIVAWNWVGVGLGIALAVTAYAMKEETP